MDFDILQQNPIEFEEWDDIILWKQSVDNLFLQAIKQYLNTEIVQVSKYYFLDCLNDKSFSEISELPIFQNKEWFIDKEYEICALFINNKTGLKFFILKKNDEFYKLDISKQYNYLLKNEYRESFKV